MLLDLSQRLKGKLKWARVFHTYKGQDLGPKFSMNQELIRSKGMQAKLRTLYLKMMPKDDVILDLKSPTPPR